MSSSTSIPYACLYLRGSKPHHSSRIVRAVINETLRLFPPVPQNERQPFRPTWLPSARSDGKPIYIPNAYTPIRYQPLLMMRRKDLWDDDACEFHPERWMDQKRMKVLAADPYRFLPFNGGPRICLGQVRFDPPVTLRRLSPSFMYACRNLHIMKLASVSVQSLQLYGLSH